jgi:hypothetical protein
MPRATSNVTASTTDGALVTAITGKKIRVTAAGVSCGGTASTVVFNSKPGGAGSAVSPIFNNSISLSQNTDGWFETNAGEGLSVSTGAGSTTGVLVIYQRRADQEPGEGLMTGVTNGVWDWDTDTIKCALTTSTYTVDIDTHDFFNDVTNEITGTGYTAGGATLASTALGRTTRRPTRSASTRRTRRGRPRR